MRPPHWRWGRYYWYPRWGWYHTAVVAGATLVYVTTLPNRSTCQTVQDPDGTLYTCDGVVYRPTYYQDEQVYEVVSAAQQPSTAASTAADTDQDVELQLSSPFLRGERVRALQNALFAIGFDVGRIDGIFGRDTDRGVREFQEWYGLEETGIVNDETAAAIGQAYASTIAPDLATYTETGDDATQDEPTLEPAIPAPESQQDGDGVSATEEDDSGSDSTAQTEQDGSAGEEASEPAATTEPPESDSEAPAQAEQPEGNGDAATETEQPAETSQ
ncbi:MAG: peptidoglycan-binding protein [Pseudomonadota bacterium]